MSYRLFVNDDRTVLVRIWKDDVTGDERAELATREDEGLRVWGPPVALTEEPV